MRNKSLDYLVVVKDERTGNVLDICVEENTCSDGYFSVLQELKRALAMPEIPLKFHFVTTDPNLWGYWNRVSKDGFRVELLMARLDRIESGNLQEWEEDLPEYSELLKQRAEQQFPEDNWEPPF